MPYKFFENAVNGGLAQMPNEAFRERQQANINALFDVTTNKYIIKEQDDIGASSYHEIEAWIGNSIGMTTRGSANGDDFKNLTFKSIDHRVKKGLYYQFNDNIWLTNSTDEHSSLDVTIGTRRCNNVLKMIDPENGSVFCIPCVLAYEMTAPNVQVTSDILTPNDHSKVLVQGNKDTFRLFKTNTRFILEGRAFKLFAFQNAINDKNIAPLPTLLTLDLFLDELHAKDDIENQIADNGDYNYSIKIDSSDMELINGTIGSLEASVTLNGQEVNREVVWESLSPGIVEIDENGRYKVLGRSGDRCTIVAKLKGNDDVFDSIEIVVADAESLTPKIIIEPSFEKVKQFQSIEFEVEVAYGNSIIKPDKVEITGSNEYFSIEQKEGKYSIIGNKVASDAQLMLIKVENASPKIKAEYSVPIKVVSMMG